MHLGKNFAALIAIIIGIPPTISCAAPLDQPAPPKQSAQILAAAAARATLPEVVVHPEGWYYDPYTNGRAQKASSLNRIRFEHFAVPAGYDADVAMHPYTSGLGPCPEGAVPAQGCWQATGNPLPPSRYERAPFNQ